MLFLFIILNKVLNNFLCLFFILKLKKLIKIYNLLKKKYYKLLYITN